MSSWRGPAGSSLPMLKVRKRERLVWRPPVAGRRRVEESYLIVSLSCWDSGGGVQDLENESMQTAEISKKLGAGPRVGVGAKEKPV